MNRQRVLSLLRSLATESLRRHFGQFWDFSQLFQDSESP